MKKILSIGIALIMAFVVVPSVFAAAELPSNTVWYEPATAPADSAITLQALVYNNQTSDATVTVDFTIPNKTKVATATALIPAQSAKTLSAVWKMPHASTVVTGTVTAAVTAKHVSLPKLLGVLGTVTAAPSVAPTTTTSMSSFPGSAQLSAWFGPLLAKIEAFRVKEAAYFTDLRDKSKAAAGLAIGTTIGTALTSQTPASDATNQIFSHPGDYFNYFYASAMVPVFSNQIIFYIVLLLAVLLVIRFIVNLFF